VIKRLKVHNAGWNMEPLTSSDVVPDAIKIRGFKIVKTDTRLLEFTTSGEYVVDEA